MDGWEDLLVNIGCMH